MIINTKKTMKYLIIIFSLIFISCKNESKIKTDSQADTKAQIENNTPKSVSEMWNDYIRSNPKLKGREIPESEFFHNNNKEDANRLAKLTLDGKKKAYSGLHSLYKLYNIDLPQVGTQQIITDFDGNAQVIIENKSIDTIPFNKISKDYAELDMGTDIEPLKKWKKAHWDFFERFLEESGKKPNEEMLIVCVRFEKIWPKN